MAEQQMQLAVVEVADDQNNRFVRIVVGVGPVASQLTFEPDMARRWLAWLNDNLPNIIATATRNNVMKGFEVVTDLPVLPKINGTDHG